MMANTSPPRHPTSAPARDKVEQDITLVLKKINDITRNQFIIDFMILIQGVNFLLHPEEAHKGIIEALAIAVFFAAFGILVGFLATHGFKKQNFHPISLSVIFIILSIVAYFMAGYLAPAFHYFIALAIIISGSFNILSAYRLIRLSHVRKTLKSHIQPDEALKSVSSTLKNSTKLEAERVLSPALIVSEKIGKFRYGQFFINLTLIAIGIAMLFFRFQTNAILLRISGSILIFSAVSDFIALVWTHRESSFAQKITHYFGPKK